ncbi:SHOCT domain-containing protein [Leucobacter weissii]|uniref:SHOCT domain-containing protein n=1 Tax=Leucobacter weissii TaxID=1983706 RepID=A0A939MKA1_9MICO|nr:SHOCT domain-containing protein [Leucobacter weissii]MBO1902534.1 SHOCT domain-containing protein [Leucobacter weissii]
MRRVGRPGLIGLAARTAVVTGTANAMQNRALRRRQDAQAQMAPEAPSPQPAPAPQPSGSAPDLTAELSKLAELHSSGLLTAEEFAAAKARLLG